MSKNKLRATPAARKYARDNNIDLFKVEGSGANGRIHKDDVVEYHESGALNVSPLARKIAEVEGLNIENLVGTGVNGKIMKKDVLALMPENNVKEVVESKVVIDNTAEIQKIPMTPMRKVIAKRMRESVDLAAKYEIKVEIDMTNLLSFRSQTKDIVEEKTGNKPSVTDYISLATIDALIKHPYVNSSLSADGTEIEIHNYVNLCIAVGTDTGLLVPVIKNADKMKFSELVSESKRIIKDTVEGKLNPSEMQGSTFTISNLGMFGVDSFTSIINQPNQAILSVGTTKKKPVVVDDEIVIRPMMNITLNADHRVIDGLEGAKFMQTLKKNLENPVGLLI